ncbi:MAG: hypothetical protein SCM96_03060 [Acidobacteriota bacterium]|nr:hypothetical protein [Acidobacteriota bacterium]
MVCRHLAPLEKDLLEAGFRETFRGRAWTKNCREWVYFDVVFDIESVLARMLFDPCVEIHENLDPKSGTERGFFCSECLDGVMGLIAGDRIYL